MLILLINNQFINSLVFLNDSLRIAFLLCWLTDFMFKPVDVEMSDEVNPSANFDKISFSRRVSFLLHSVHGTFVTVRVIVSSKMEINCAGVSCLNMIFLHVHTLCVPFNLLWRSVIIISLPSSFKDDECSNLIKISTLLLGKKDTDCAFLLKKCLIINCNPTLK